MVVFDSTDLDNAVSESGVVHESVANTDHNDASNLKQGYQIANPYLSADLTLYCPLQEDSGGTANDFAGTNDGTTFGGVTQGATGLLGTSAYSFDGTDDYVGFPTINSVFDGSGGWAVSFWVRLNSSAINNAENGIVTFRDNYFGPYHISDNGNLDLRTFDGSTIYNCIDSNPNADVWTHYVFQATGAAGVGGLELYKNASVIDTNANWDTTTESGSNRLMANDALANFIGGSLAEFRVYNTPLSSSQIQFLHDVVASSGTLTTQYKTV